MDSTGCACDTHDLEKTILKNSLPENYDYRLCTFESNENDPDKYRTSFRMRLTTREEVEVWFKAFQEKSAITWRVMKTYPCNKGLGFRKKNVFRMDYRCHHNTRPGMATERRKTSKHTSCEASLYIVVKRQADQRGRASRSTDPHLRAGYLTKITINNIHNHAIRSAEVLRHRDVSQETRARLLKLYEEGLRPMAALDALKKQLQEEFSADYTQKSADRSICPDLPYCWRLYYSLYKPNNHQKIRKSLLKALESRLRHDDVNENYFKIGTTDEGHAVIAICSASMQRVHEFWPTSKDLCYLDTSSGYERQNWHLTILLTPSPVGELPLGIFLMSSDSPKTLSLGFQLLHELLPSFSFGARGHSGPSVVVTRDNVWEYSTLREVYPTADVLINPHNVLKSAKDWIWDPDNQIGKGDQLGLIQHLSALLDARTPEDLSSCYDLAKLDAEHRNYPKYIQYLSDIYERSEMWSAVLKTSPVLLENRVSASIKVPMEKILQKVKGYNVLMLVNDLLTQFGPYYERKLVDAGNNRLERLSFASYPGTLLGPETLVKKVSEIDYEVLTPSSDTQAQLCYHVNIEQGLCTCHGESTQVPCQHQMAVYKKFNGKIQGTFFPAQLRSLFIKIAAGEEAPADEGWYQPLVMREVQLAPDGKQVLLNEDMYQAVLQLTTESEQLTAGTEQMTDGSQHTTTESEELAIGSEHSTAESEELTINSEQQFGRSEKMAIGSGQMTIGSEEEVIVLEEQAAVRTINGDNDTDDDEDNADSYVDDQESYAPHEMHQKLQEVFADLEKRLLGDPVAFEGLLDGFTNNYWKAVQKGELESALMFFGDVAGCKIRKTHENRVPDRSQMHAVGGSFEGRRRKKAVKKC